MSKETKHTLVITTSYPDTVLSLIRQFDLVSDPDPLKGPDCVVSNYPNDTLSQEFACWLATAQGCGLVATFKLR